jgi:hypothetical protein
MAAPPNDPGGGTTVNDPASARFANQVAVTGEGSGPGRRHRDGGCRHRRPCVAQS